MPEERAWKTKIKEFEARCMKVRASKPDLSISQIAKQLNIGHATAYRMISVLRHMDDPRISNSTTLNQAYGKIKTHYQTADDTISEITNVVNLIVPTGEPE